MCRLQDGGGGGVQHLWLLVPALPGQALHRLPGPGVDHLVSEQLLQVELRQVVVVVAGLVVLVGVGVVEAAGLLHLFHRALRAPHAQLVRLFLPAQLLLWDLHRSPAWGR